MYGFRYARMAAMWRRLVQRIRCWLGKHEPKFSTWPHCAWCGQLVKGELE